MFGVQGQQSFYLLLLFLASLLVVTFHAPAWTYQAQFIATTMLWAEHNGKEMSRSILNGCVGNKLLTSQFMAHINTLSSNVVKLWIMKLLRNISRNLTWPKKNSLNGRSHGHLVQIVEMVFFYSNENQHTKKDMVLKQLFALYIRELSI